MCHSWIHAEPRGVLREPAWLVRRGADPAEQPAETLLGTLLMLLPDGSVRSDPLPQLTDIEVPF